MTKQWIIPLLFLLILSGCSTSPSGKSEAQRIQERQQMISRLQAQREQIQRLRNRESVLATKLQRERQAGKLASEAAPQELYNRSKQLHKKGLHGQALKQANQFLRKYKSHSLTPAVLELKANTLAALRLPDLADSIWQDILLNYPRSSAAQRAQQILQQAQRNAD